MLRWLEFTGRLVNMSRILRRPMFKKGGPTNNMNGIMTGIVDRTNHAEDGGPAMDFLNNIVPTAEEMTAFKEAMPQRPETEYKSFDPLTRFLLTFGPAYASAKPTGNFLSTALQASQPAFQDLLKAKDLERKEKREEAKEQYITESDAFSTLLSAKAKALSGTGSQKTYRDLVVNQEIKRLVPEITRLETALQAEDLQDADKIKLQNQLEAAKISLNNLKKSDPAGEALLSVFVESPQGSNFFNNTLNTLYKQNPEQYPGGKNDPKLLEDTVKKTREFINNMMTTRVEEKDGGRIGLAQSFPGTAGEAMKTKTTAPQNDNPISFDQLRARLPKEITNDIVTLMSNSAEALEDFALIQSQEDVNNFNKKYNVNLVLPAEA